MLIPNKHSGYQSGIRLYPGGGKGGNSAPPPDPRLVQAQIDSMGVQNDAIKEIMSNSRDMAPLQRQQLQFGLDSSKTAWDQSQADREWALGRRGELTGMQDRMISDAKSFNEGDRANQLGEEAMQGVNASFANAQGMTARNLASRGINMNSGAALASMNDNSLMQAVAAANAGNKVREAARQEGYALTDRAAGALNGYPTMGMQATGAGAGFGAAGLGLTNSGLSGMNSGWNTAGGLGGAMGSNATGMYGAQSQYKLGMDKLSQSEADPFGAILGQGAGALAAGLGKAAATQGGMASMAAFLSDRRLKTNVKLLGTRPDGLNVYSYNFIDGGPTIVGVMADEVAVFRPDAYIAGAWNGFDGVDYSKL
jgi:hypothetical protein